MEETGTTTSHCKFYGAHSCAHGQKTIPLALIHPFTRQIVATFSVSRIKVHRNCPVTKCFYAAVVFSFFHLFLSHTFCGACVTPCESLNFYLKHSFSTYTCLSNNLLISAWILIKFVSHVCSTRQTTFRYLNVFERYFYTACFITRIPLK